MAETARGITLGGINRLKGISTELRTPRRRGFCLDEREHGLQPTSPPAWQLEGGRRGVFIFSEGGEGVSHRWNDLTTPCMCHAGACAGGEEGTAANVKCSRATAGRRALA